MLQKVDAIVLSKLKYSDSDLIVNCFSLQKGTCTYLLKGVLKSKKGKLRPALFTAFNELEIEEYSKSKGALQHIKEVKINHKNSTLNLSFSKSAIVMFLSEILNSVLRNEEENRALYEYLSSFIQLLDREEQVANFHLLFLVKLTRFIGIQPDIGNKEGIWFNLLEGKFEDIKTSNSSITGENVIFLKTLLGINFDEVKNIKFNSNQRQSFLKMIVKYYEYHVPGFKEPKSLEVLNSLFNQ